MNHKKTKKGYLRYAKDESGRLRFEHCIAWEKHNGPIPLGMQIHHIDFDKTNNNISNLEWTTYSGNNIHALRSGLRKPRGNTIAQLQDDGSVVGVYRSTCEATRQTGISIGSISHCLNGRTHHAGGYVWKKVLEDVTTIPTGSTPEDELPVEVQR